MPDVRHTLSDLSTADLHGAVWCGVLCARTAGHLAPRRCGPALRLAALWACGVEVSKQRMRAAADAAPLSATPDFAGFAASAAMLAAYPLPETAADAAAEAVARAAGIDRDRGVAQHFVLLGGMVDDQIRAVELRRATSPLGDWLLENSERRRVGTLGEALARAWRHRLRWWVPAERALAERFEELPGGGLRLSRAVNSRGRQM